jgi:primosomal protein N' (replication factor Y)
MTSDSTVQVLLPLALDGAYTYTVPEGMVLAPGDYVRVPLGPRQMTGVVWQVGGKTPDATKLRAVVERYDCPAMPALHMKFIDWVARYYLENPGQVLRMCLRVPKHWQASASRLPGSPAGNVPDKMTSQRQRVLEVARTGWRGGQAIWRLEAGVSAGVVKGLAGARRPQTGNAARAGTVSRPGAGAQSGDVERGAGSGRALLACSGDGARVFRVAT